MKAVRKKPESKTAKMKRMRRIRARKKLWIAEKKAAKAKKSLK